jgi:hypothetical protein
MEQTQSLYTGTVAYDRITRRLCRTAGGHVTRPRLQNNFAFGVYVLLGVLAAGAQEPPTVGATNLTSLSVIDAAWDAHLADANDNPENREWKFRARLERNPLDHEAIMGLVAHFDARGEGTLELAAFQYAVYGGFATNAVDIKRLVDETAGVRQLNEQGKVDGDPFVEVRMEWFKEMLEAGKKLNISLSTYGDMETENRSLIRKSALRQDLLIALAQQYQHHREWSMAAMVAMLVLQLDPNNEDMLDLCLEILIKPGYERFGELMLAYYAKREGLKLPQLKRFIALSEEQEHRAHSLVFRAQAARLEPKNPEHWEYLGAHYHDRRENVRAFKLLMHAVKLPDHSPGVYLMLARISAYDGDVPSTALWLEKWRLHASEDQLVATLLRDPFRRHPRLLRELE